MNDQDDKIFALCFINEILNAVKKKKGIRGWFHSDRLIAIADAEKLSI